MLRAVGIAICLLCIGCVPEPGTPILGKQIQSIVLGKRLDFSRVKADGSLDRRILMFL